MTIDEALEDARKKRTTNPVDAALQSSQGDGSVDPTAMVNTAAPGRPNAPTYLQSYNMMQRQGPLMLASEGKQFNSMVDKQFAGQTNDYNETMKANSSDYGTKSVADVASQRSVLANALGQGNLAQDKARLDAEKPFMDAKTQGQRIQNELYGSTVAAQQEVLRAQAKFYNGGGQPSGAAAKTIGNALENTPSPANDVPSTAAQPTPPLVRKGKSKLFKDRITGTTFTYGPDGKPVPFGYSTSQY
jgi:hypothetical protein